MGGEPVVHSTAARERWWHVELEDKGEVGQLANSASCRRKSWAAAGIQGRQWEINRKMISKVWLL
jgi:hypothetical protein